MTETKEARGLFNKLKSKWGISVKGKSVYGHGRQGVMKQGLFYECHWMGKLRPGYKRLTFKDFLKLYDIKNYSEED